MAKFKKEYKDILFSVCCDEWLESKKNIVKESSYFNYKFIVEKHIKPVLGSKTLSEMEKYDMNQFIKIKKEEGITKCLKEILGRIKLILKFIKKKYEVNFGFDFTKGYVAKSGQLEVFDEKEKQKMSKYLSSSNDIRNLGVLITLYSGLRIGEICGLKWKDIDLKKKEIYIQRTVQRVYTGKGLKSKIVVTSPKTVKSIRKIPISKVLIDILEKRQKEYNPECYVTTGDINNCFEPFSYRYVYRRILEQCNIPYRKFHCLRHTFATRCIRVGMDIKSLSEVLGHSNITTTMNIYVHSCYEIKKKYIDRL